MWPMLLHFNQRPNFTSKSFLETYFWNLFQVTFCTHSKSVLLPFFACFLLFCFLALIFCAIVHVSIYLIYKLYIGRGGTLHVKINCVIFSLPLSFFYIQLLVYLYIFVWMTFHLLRCVCARVLMPQLKIARVIKIRLSQKQYMCILCDVFWFFRSVSFYIQNFSDLFFWIEQYLERAASASTANAVTGRWIWCDFHIIISRV